MRLFSGTDLPCNLAVVLVPPEKRLRSAVVLLPIRQFFCEKYLYIRWLLLRSAVIEGARGSLLEWAIRVHLCGIDGRS